MTNLRDRFVPTCFAAALLSFIAATRGGAEPVPLGPELVLDGNAKNCTVLAARDDGSFAVAWMTQPGRCRRRGWHPDCGTQIVD